MAEETPGESLAEQRQSLDEETQRRRRSASRYVALAVILSEEFDKEK